MLKSIRRTAAAVLYCASACSPAMASEAPPPILDIATYRSPSGEYALTVDPSQLHGQGAGSYRMTKNGKKIWSRELAFTLFEALVTNAGEVMGYAYTNGWRGLADQPNDPRPGKFIVAMISANGATRLAKSVLRVDSRIMHTAPNPKALGIFADTVNDRFVVRFESDAGNAEYRGERWEVYTLSAARAEPDIKVVPVVDKANVWYRAIDARPIGSTGLTLVPWHRSALGPPREEGLRLSLVDTAGREVWSKEWPGEFSKIAGFSRSMIEASWLFPTRSVTSNELTYRSISEQARITFSVDWNPGAPGTWKVHITRRVPEAIGLRATRPLGKLDAAPIALERRGVISFDVKSGDAHSLGVGDFEFDGAGRIGFVAPASGGRFQFTLVDPARAPPRKVALPFGRQSDTAFPKSAWVGGDNWVILYARSNHETSTKAWVLDANAGTVALVEGFASPAPAPDHGAAGAGSRGFVVLGMRHSELVITDSVTAFGATGERLWTVERPGMSYSPQAVATRPDGRVGVLIGISNQIVVLSDKGVRERTIDLDRSLGVKPNYVSGLDADEDGGWILHDFQGTPPVYRLDAAGRIKKAFEPRYSDGRVFRITGGVRRAPDGRLWTSDGAALLRLDGDGTVDLVLGRPPDASSIDRLASLAVDHQGHFYAADQRNGWVHVFDTGAKRLRILKPGPRDFAINHGIKSITVAGDGGVYCRTDNDRHLKFTSDGTRAGFQPRISGSVRDRWFFRPGSLERVVLGYERAYLVDAAGKTNATIERRADGRWLAYPHEAAVARDGSFAIVAVPAPSALRPAGPPSVTFFSVRGAPTRTVDLPGMAYPGIAFDGKTGLIVSAETLLLVDAASGRARSFPIPGGKKPSGWVPYASTTKKEAWLLDVEAKALHRYSLPTF